MTRTSPVTALQDRPPLSFVERVDEVVFAFPTNVVCLSLKLPLISLKFRRFDPFAMSADIGPKLTSGKAATMSAIRRRSPDAEYGKVAHPLRT
jgi:hypothetical protein